MNSLRHGCLLLVAACSASVLAVTPASAQFDQVPIPTAMVTLDFMVGEWTVRGAFRTPDHIGTDRTLWYMTRGGGITRFDGQSWTAYAPGDAPAPDSILQLISARADPYAFTNPRNVTWIQDGFALLVDGGRTSGSSITFFDTAQSEWVSTAFHAPTNGVTRSVARLGEGLPIFEGRATDRRGERIFRRRYERHGTDSYTIQTDVSFDEGVTWIDDQMVQEVRRR